MTTTPAQTTRYSRRWTRTPAAKVLHGNTPHGGTCLTSAQVGALKKIYAGPKNSRGKSLYSNWFWDAGIWDPPTAGGLGWAAWNVAFFGPPNVNTALNLTLGAGAVPMVFRHSSGRHAGRRTDGPRSLYVQVQLRYGRAQDFC